MISRSSEEDQMMAQAREENKPTGSSQLRELKFVGEKEGFGGRGKREQVLIEYGKERQQQNGTSSDGPPRSGRNQIDCEL